MAMAMASCSLLVVLSLLVSHAAAETGVVLPACKTVGGGSKDFTVDFCVSALESDGRSAAAKDYRDLAVVAFDLTAANATATRDEVNRLLKRPPGWPMEQCLRSCKTLYDGAVRGLAGSRNAVRDRRDGDAAASLDRSASSSAACEGGFAKAGLTSPVAEGGSDTVRLARLTQALLRFARGARV